MSFNPPSQLLSSKLGVRFGALASLRQEPGISQSLHTSALINSDEGRVDSSISPAPISTCSADVVQYPLLPVPPSSMPGVAAAITQFQLQPIAIQGPDVTANPHESLAAPKGGEAKKLVEPPSTLLEYGISREQFLAARAAPAGTPKSFWSYTMYHRIGDNGAVDNVKVHYCESKSTMERVCNEYFLNEDVIGLDLEWMRYALRTDGPRHNVSVIQIASPSRVALFHVALFKKDSDLVGPSFRKIMENPNVSKVGVNIGPDCTRLKHHLGVTVQGIFELSHLYKLVKYLPEKRNLINKGLVSLATQVEDQLLLPLYKGQLVRTGNWMRRLNSQQIHYSASDAYAGLQLYYVLEEKRKALVPCPPRPYHAELRLPIPLPDPPVTDDKVDEDASLADPTSAASTTDATTPAPKPKVPRPRASSAKAPSSEIPTANVPPSEAPASEAPDSKAPAPSETKPKPRQRPDKPADNRDARVIAAEVEMKEYRSAKKTARLEATPSSLRAYYIWHRNEDLCPADIAALLRDPPLLTGTVAGYVLDAIRAENLPYPALRLHDEVVPLIDLTKPYWLKHETLIRECSEAVTKMKREKESNAQHSDDV
ncbi:ribonuclease h [Trichoderma cornu-damae]|uniref:Ribonuclease h n=1 Tax=Trichoderma cornu-damae TaxID=654480 RepID=A0A9P8TX29_9HYPO|nr:ribonuclease h [Trichoderma cornu-damae]